MNTVERYNEIIEEEKQEAVAAIDVKDLEQTIKAESLTDASALDTVSIMDLYYPTNPVMREAVIAFVNSGKETYLDRTMKEHLFSIDDLEDRVSERDGVVYEVFNILRKLFSKIDYTGYFRFVK